MVRALEGMALQNGAPYAEAGFVQRVVGAARLDEQLYRYVSEDPQTRRHAIGVVVFTGLANGVTLTGKFGSVALGVGLFLSVISWLLWSAVVALVARLNGGRRDARSLLRAMAFANSPGLLLFLGLLPNYGSLLRALVAIWMVVATVPGVRAVYDLPRWRASGVTLAAFVIYWGVGQAADYFAG